MTAAGAPLRLSRVRIALGARVLIDDFSALVAPGECTTVMGPSGSGKSTLLNLLGALDFPTSGEIHFGGRPLNGEGDLNHFRAQTLGFVFQSFHLIPTLTSLENVQIPMFETDCSRSEREERAFTLLKAVGLEHRLDHFPGKLSGGERQRVAIARSLANNPSILLADEPTGNLDSVNARLVLDLIERLRSERRMTLVLVTHDQTIARRASRVLSMSDGRIASDHEAMAIPART